MCCVKQAQHSTGAQQKAFLLHRTEPTLLMLAGLLDMYQSQPDVCWGCWTPRLCSYDSVCRKTTLHDLSVMVEARERGSAHLCMCWLGLFMSCSPWGRLDGWMHTRTGGYLQINSHQTLVDSGHWGHRSIIQGTLTENKLLCFQYFYVTVDEKCFKMTSWYKWSRFCIILELYKTKDS